MKAHLKFLFCSLPLAGLPVVGLIAWSTPAAIADTVKITPTAPTSTTVTRTSIDGTEPAMPLDPKDYPQGLLFPYSLFDDALKGNVDLNGNVAYNNLKDNKKLNYYLQAAAHANLSEFPVFDVYSVDDNTGRKTKVRKDRTPELVFWLNTYNASILSSIAQAYPIKSIDLIKDFDTVKAHRVAGKNYSLKEMRDKVASFGDPRALFALASGTAGGFLPSPTAIRYVELKMRLDSAVSVFVNDQRNVTLSRIQNLVIVSPMFKDVDAAFSTGGKRNKWNGIRQILSGYTTQRGNRSYFTTNDYRIDFGKTNRGINDQFNSSIVNSVETLD